MIKKIYKSAAKGISASRYGSVRMDGEKLSSTKFKKHILEKIKSGGISSKKLDDMLKQEGLTKSQLAKRKRLIKMLTGADTEKLSKKEERKIAERVKMRISAARRSSEMMGSGDERAASAAESLKKRKLDKAGALKNATTQNGEKVGMGAIGIAGQHGVASAKSVGGNNPSPSTGGSSSIGNPFRMN